jgi:tetratricopeptide (TPR) repeat protein
VSQATPSASDAKRVFFISRAGKDREQAKTLAGWLEAVGYGAFVQDWDIEPGQDFLAKIHGALSEGAHVVALLTDDYLKSPWCQMEWNAAYKVQTESGERRLSPIRIKECQPAGIMAAVTYIDLVGLGEEPARQEVLKLARSIGKVERVAGKWSIPAPQDRPRLDNLDPFDASIFKGRQTELDQLHDQLNDSSQIAITALAGLGGVGKSALAHAFCDRYGADYEVIWWVRSEKESDAEADLARLAIEWNPANADLGDRRQQAFEAIKIASQWSGRRPFLVVFDNVATPSVIRPFRPGGSCRVIVTSRNTSWTREWRPITVRKLDPDIGAQLLLAASGRDDYEGARKLALELDGLALPLSHAAAILRENAATTFADLSRRFDAFMQKQTDDEDVRTTYATYSCAIEQLAERDSVSRHIMSAAAYCAPEAIPAAILRQALNLRMAEALIDVAADADRMKDALGSLARYSLVEVERGDADALAVSVHRVVQRVVRKQHAEGNEHIAWGCATLRSIYDNCNLEREKSLRHGREALAVVPSDACPDVWAQLEKLIEPVWRAGDEPVPTASLILRARKIEQIHLFFTERNERIVMLTGAAGSGKTSLAHMYAEQHRRSYEQVWWLKGGNETELLRELTDIARKAGNPVEVTETQYAARQALEFAHNLGRRRPILLILDEVDDHGFIDRWIRSPNIKVLLCSRWRPTVRTAGPIVHLDVLSQADSVALLELIVPELERSDMQRLVEVAAGSSLALTLMANALRKGEMSPSDLTAAAPTLAAYVQRSLDLFQPSARALLHLVSLCAPQELPLSLVEQVARGGVPDIGSDALEASIESAARFLVRGTDTFGPYIVGAHPGVMAAIREALSPEERHSLGNAALSAVSDLMPHLEDPVAWAFAERLVIHGEAIGRNCPVSAEVKARAYALFGNLRLRMGEHDAALPLLEEAREAWWKADQAGLGMAAVLSDIASARASQGELRSALEAAEESLNLKTQLLGPDHAAVADSLEVLADIRMRYRDFDSAERNLRRAIDIRRTLGNDRMLGRGLNRLSTLLVETHRVAEAERAAREALDLVQRTDGPEYPSTAMALINLAGVLRGREAYEDAERLLQRALVITERTLGPDHPDVAEILIRLGRGILMRSRFAEAEAVLRRALAINEASFGPDHPRVADNLSWLAQVLQRSERLSEAEPVLRRVLAIWKANPETTGEAHAAARALAELLEQTGRADEAADLLNRQSLE